MAGSAATRYGIPPIPRALKTFAELTNQQVEILRAEVEGPEGFELPYSRCEEVAAKLGEEDASKIVSLIGTLDFLYGSVREWTDGPDDGRLEDTLRDFLKSTGLWSQLGDDSEQKFALLLSFLERNDAEDKRAKLKWLRTGILETATGFASFVDLRPNFSADRKEVMELIPVTIFRISCETEGGGNDKTHVFQLTPNGVRGLRKAVDDLVDKLKVIETGDWMTSLAQKKATAAKEKK